MWVVWVWVWVWVGVGGWVGKSVSGGVGGWVWVGGWVNLLIERSTCPVFPFLYPVFCFSIRYAFTEVLVRNTVLKDKCIVRAV